MRSKHKHNKKQKSRILSKLDMLNDVCAVNEEFDTVYTFGQVIKMYNDLLDKYEKLRLSTSVHDYEMKLQQVTSECNRYHVLWTDLRRQHAILKKLVGRLALNATYYADIANKASDSTTKFTKQDNKIVMLGNGTSIELEVEDA